MWNRGTHQTKQLHNCVITHGDMGITLTTEAFTARKQLSNVCIKKQVSYQGIGARSVVMVHGRESQ